MAEHQTNKLGYGFVDLTGQRFNKLTVVRYCDSSKWLCRCDCGTEVVRYGSGLKSGTTISCGCHRGYSLKRGRPEFYVWWAARNRCINPSAKNYARYGGRGISMCERWINSFENFISDMGPRLKGMTLDRIDNDGPYSPDNCRWATYLDQTRNRKKTLTVTHEGVTLTLSEWSERTGIPYDRLHDRHINNKPLFAPSHQGQGPKRKRHSN